MSTQKQIAEHLDISQQEISKLMADLAIDWKKTPLEEIRVAYIRKLRAVAAGHRSSDGLDLTHERVLTERVDRELKSLLLAEKRGLLVNVDQLEPELTQMVIAFRTEVLSLADKIKADLDVLHGIDVDLQLLNDLIHECLDQLARYDPERAGTAAPAAGQGGAAAADDDDGVGQGTPPA